MRFKYILFVSILMLISCENQIESESLTYNCYGNLSSPGIHLTGTNDFYFEPSNSYGSTYYFSIEHDSDCLLDEYSDLLATLELFKGDVLAESFYISYSEENLIQNENIISGGMGILFGDADNAKITFKMQNLLGNEISIKIDKHDGAN